MTDLEKNPKQIRTVLQGVERVLEKLDVESIGSSVVQQNVPGSGF